QSCALFRVIINCYGHLENYQYFEVPCHLIIKKKLSWSNVFSNLNVRFVPKASTPIRTKNPALDRVKFTSCRKRFVR
ncbi:MAG: hypothetical protein O7D86_00085, partial [Proteobacteria bacterium]|nr:hypothetical protein [Pseudomonadota bacterium]